jgi:hypothetical protein
MSQLLTGFLVVICILLLIRHFTDIKRQGDEQ